MEPVYYTTVAKDKYGRYYDLSKEHPSWEEKKKGLATCTVVDAFTCTVEEADRLTKRSRKSPEPASSEYQSPHSVAELDVASWLDVEDPGPTSPGSK
jgi:hypothetical protein